jgi:putative nucleotidyltransferase with HDIG domain
MGAAIIMTKDFETFRQQIAETGDIPTIPTVLMDLLALLNDDQTTTDEIAETISQTVGLTARLLKLANSSATGLRVQITSIHRAVALLGREQVRQICLGESVWSTLKPLANKAKFNLEAFEIHSLFCAEVAQALANQSGLVTTEDVYAAALLHDIGKFLLLAFERENYVETLLVAKETNRNLIEVEQEKLGWNHTQLGEWLSQLWNLPHPIQAAIAHHHHPDEFIEQEHGAVIALISIANNLMKLLKIGDSGNVAVRPIGSLLTKLNLTPNDLQEIAVRLKG